MLSTSTVDISGMIVGPIITSGIFRSTKPLGQQIALDCRNEQGSIHEP